KARIDEQFQIWDILKSAIRRRKEEGSDQWQELQPECSSPVFSLPNCINTGVRKERMPTTTTKAPAIRKAFATPIHSAISPVNNRPIILGRMAMLKYRENTL